MACKHWEPLLSRLVDGELAESEKAGLERHLEECRKCCEELTSFRELSDVLAARTEPDPFFLTRFRARRDEKQGAEGTLLPWRRFAVRLLPLAVAALLGAAATVWLSVEEGDFSDLEARELGDGFIAYVSEEEPVLHMAFEPFPGGEP